MPERVYDPRDSKWKESNNPALLFLNLMFYSCEPISDNTWENITFWANFCDEEVINGYTRN